MVDFPSAVAVPSSAAYQSGAVDFSWLGDLLNKYSQGQQQQFQQQQRDLTTQQQQTFKNNFPTDANGNPDYRAITKMLAQKGDIAAIGQLGPLVQVQNSGQVSPLTAQLLGLPPQGNAAPQSPQGPQPQQNAPAPASVPARATAPAAGGGDQGGSLVDVVSAKIPDAQAGPIIAQVAKVMGVDPNATLTPGQQKRAAVLASRYAGGDTASNVNTAPTTPASSAAPGSRVDQAFTAFPPSAGAGTTAPTLNVRPNAPQAPQQPQQQAQPAQPQQLQPQQGAQQPLVPQVPFPVDPKTGQRFTDPQAAIMALNTAMMQTRNPQEVGMLKDWRDRIESSTAPVKMAGNETLVDPRTRAIIAQGPQAAAMANAEPSATLAADAERYRQTGTLPPNMGRGVQGQQQATAIRSEAVRQEVEAGGDPGTWPQRWQQFKTQGGYPDQIKDWRDGIKSGDIPPVGIPAKIRGPVTAGLEEDKFNLSKATIEWNRAQKQIQSLNGPQMTRFVGLATSVTNTIDEVKELADQMKLSGIPLLNRGELASYIQTQGNSENGQLAARYIGAVGTLKEEFANLANGGYAPTEPAWALANGQINGDYGVKELGASLDEVQRLIKYRINAVPNLSTMGPGAGDRYTPPNAGGQAAQPQAPAAGGGNVVQWVRKPDGSLGPAQ